MSGMQPSQRNYDWLVHKGISTSGYRLGLVVRQPYQGRKCGGTSRLSAVLFELSKHLLELITS